MISLAENYLSCIYEWAMVRDELALRNSDGRFATIGVKEVSAGAMDITDQDNANVYRYDSISDVIYAGWVVD